MPLSMMTNTGNHKGLPLLRMTDQTGTASGSVHGLTKHPVLIELSRLATPGIRKVGAWAIWGFPREPSICFHLNGEYNDH